MHSLRWAWILLPLAATAALPSNAFSQDKVVPKKDYLAEPTSWGNVFGRVYDAESGAPIAKATVAIQGDDGEFRDTGKTVGTTNALGLYRANAVVGRVSQNFDIGRAISSSLIGILFGGAINTTKRLDVTRLNLSVRAPGYKSFLGPVQARMIDAKAMRLDMHPILLVPQNSATESTVASNWGVVRIESVEAQPPVAKPGDKVRLTAKVFTPGGVQDKDLELKAVSPWWKGERKLSLVKGSITTYATELQIEKQAQTSAETATVFISRSSLDVLDQDQRKQVLLQVATDQATESAARTRALAFTEAQKNHSSSLRLFESLANEPLATDYDLRTGFDLALRYGDYGAAKETSSKMLQRLERQKNPSQTQRAFAVLAGIRANYLAGDHQKAVEIGQAELDSYKRKDWAKKIYPSVPATMGLALVKMGDLEKAAKINEDLEVWSGVGATFEAVEFREALRMAQVEKAIAANPTDAMALSDYGRALLDRGRYEEAVVKLKAALVADPNAAAVKRDLAWAALHLGPKAEVENLDEAVEEAKQAVRAEDPKKGTKDFFGWSRYASLLYAKTARDKGDESFGKEYEPVMDALRQSVKLGRMGQEVNDGLSIFSFGYLSGSRVAVAGFAYPEAAACFQMLDAIRRLRQKPSDHLSRHALAQALTELGQTTLAARQINHILRDQPEFTEAVYLQSRIAVKDGDDAAARRLLETVLARNPRHPKANLDLAEVLTREGDSAGAAQYLATHAKWYGSPSE